VVINEGPTAATTPEPTATTAPTATPVPVKTEIPDKSELTRKRTTNFYRFEEAADYYSAYLGVISLTMRKRIGYQDTVLYDCIYHFEPCLYAWETENVDYLSKKQKAQYEVMQSILAEASKLETDYEKERFLYDYLLENTVPAKAFNGNNFLAYDTLVTKESQYVSITRAFSILLSMSGIENCYMDTCTDSFQGDSANVNNYPLSKLLVMLDGEWYCADIGFQFDFKYYWNPITLDYYFLNIAPADLESMYDMMTEYFDEYSNEILSSNYPNAQGSEHYDFIKDKAWLETEEEIRACFDAHWEGDEYVFFYCSTIEGEEMRNLIQDFGYSFYSADVSVPGGWCYEIHLRVQEYN